MRKFTFRITILFVLFVVSFTLSAQHKLYLHDKDGTKASFSLEGIRKLTFPSRTITLYQNDGTTQAFPFIELRQARFTEFVTGNNGLDLAQTNNLVLFPNPVNNELTLGMLSPFVVTVDISIVDAQGKTVITRKERILQGNNQINLQLSDLPQGLYLCRVKNGKSVETRKFLKN